MPFSPLYHVIVAGVLAAAAFPPAGLWPLSAVALVPFLAALKGQSPLNAFRLGWCFGLVYFTLMLWWLVPTISRFGSMPLPASAPVIGLLVCYLALFPAVWAAAAAWLLADRRRLASGLVLALAWGGLEWLRGVLLSGFPWGTLAYALAPRPLLFQSVNLAGPYALSSVVVLVNILLWQILSRMGSIRSAPGGRESAKLLRDILLAVVVMGAVLAYGAASCRNTLSSDARYPALDAAAIQGSLPQDEKWEPGIQRHTVELYRKLTLQAVSGLPPAAKKRGVLVVWPETSLPFFYQTGRDLSRMVRETARDAGVALLFGSPAFRAGGSGGRAYFNRAYLLDEHGNTVGSYDKMHLVPFGEYLPWGQLTAWARDLVPAAGDFSPGASAAPLVWHSVRVGVLICFESIFPELSRKSVALGANLLAVITNDSWFGDTGAPWQHAAMAAFRAVETRRWIVRAANTGVSEIISPTGRVVAKSSLFRQDIVQHTIRLRDDVTIYQRYGDAPFLLLAAASLCLLAAGVVKEKICSAGITGNDLS